VWDRLQEYILAYPHHRIQDWLILQNFYNGLTSTSRAHINAAAGGAFFSLTVNEGTTLIEKMVTNQGWSEEKLQTQKDAMHTLEETDMLAVNYIS
jgi:putative NADH-flavin reductase